MGCVLNPLVANLESRKNVEPKLTDGNEYLIITADWDCFDYCLKKKQVKHLINELQSLHDQMVD